jgi:hypothetical protein
MIHKRPSMRWGVRDGILFPGANENARCIGNESGLHSTFGDRLQFGIQPDPRGVALFDSPWGGR